MSSPLVFKGTEIKRIDFAINLYRQERFAGAEVILRSVLSDRLSGEGALSASAARAAPGLTSAAVLKKFAAMRTLFSGGGREMKP